MSCSLCKFKRHTKTSSVQSCLNSQKHRLSLEEEAFGIHQGWLNEIIWDISPSFIPLLSFFNKNLWKAKILYVCLYERKTVMTSATFFYCYEAFISKHWVFPSPHHSYPSQYICLLRSLQKWCRQKLKNSFKIKEKYQSMIFFLGQHWINSWEETTDPRISFILLLEMCSLFAFSGTDWCVYDLTVVLLSAFRES